MPEVTVERRSAPRHAMVLAAEVIELPRGAKLFVRTADISRTGCYIDTLNPIPPAYHLPKRSLRNRLRRAKIRMSSPGIHARFSRARRALSIAGSCLLTGEEA